MLMVQTAYKTDPSVSSTLRSDISMAVWTFFAIGFFIYLSFFEVTSPAPTPLTAPPEEFSSGRAIRHVAAISQRAHPVGSSEHAAVRDYILKEIAAIGLHAEIQKTVAINAQEGGPVLAATVENILARMPGTDSRKAVLLAAHYDSVATGPGASDDGAGVATLLETMRCLRVGPALKNELMFLFTDAEENGLLGAKAFVDENPAAECVGLVLNFEARGIGGPAIMFETSRGNEWLIDEFAKAAPRPVANSLSYEIYERLPNDTDLTIFKSARLQGFNFAYIRGLNYYHTQIDSVENLDQGSLQHHGSYALSLALHFGNLGFEIGEEKERGDAIYFNIPGSKLVRYPVAWALPLSLLCAIIFAAVLALGLSRKRLTLRGILFGFFAFLSSILASAIVVSVAWRVINGLRSTDVSVTATLPYNDVLYLVAWVMLAIALTSALYLWFGKRTSIENLTVGALLLWLILALLTSLSLPGGSYLFVWPLLFSLFAQAFVFIANNEPPGSLKLLAVLLISALPAIVLIVPMIYFVFLAIGLGIPSLLAIMTTLTLGLLVPHIALMSKPKKWLLPGMALLVSAICILAASLTLGFDNSHRKSDSLFYALSADSGKAVWVSFDEQPDEWTSQFFNGPVERGSISDYAPVNYDRFLKSDAPPLEISPPNVTVMNDTSTGDLRVLSLHIISTRQAPVIMMVVDQGAQILSTTINGRRVAHADNRSLLLGYFAPPKEGIDLTLESKLSGVITMQVSDQSYGLPESPGISFRARPESAMPAPLPFSDSTLVTKSFSF